VIDLVLNILIELKVPSDLFRLPPHQLIATIDKLQGWNFNQVRAVEMLCSITSTKDARELLEAAYEYLGQEHRKRCESLAWLPLRLRRLIVWRNKRLIAIGWAMEAIQSTLDTLPVIPKFVSEIQLQDEFAVSKFAMLAHQASHEQCKELAVSVFSALKVQEAQYRNLLAHQWGMYDAN
jgi:hypothetical protein